MGRLFIGEEGNIGYDGWMTLSAYNDKLEREYKEWSIVEVFSVDVLMTLEG